MGTHIYLNRRDRFSNGLLSQEEAHRLAREMHQALLDVRDPVDGEPVIRAVYLREEVYHGEAVGEAPDLIIEYANRYAPSAEPRPVNPGLEGGHVPEGVLLAWGPAIRSGPAPEAGLVHLAPTVLHLLGEPVPPDMDGRVLETLLAPEWLARHPVQIGGKPATVGLEVEAGYTPDQLADVEAQLRALGYIE
jgi:predicted AlkP superfamily phosphohydrolase/phosphomutase